MWKPVCSKGRWRSSRTPGSSLLDVAGVPCSPVNTIDKVFASEQVRHRGMLATVSAGTPDEAAAVGPAIKYSAFDVSAGWTAPPRLGCDGRGCATPSGVS